MRKSSKAVVVENIFSGSHKGSIDSARSGIKVSVESSPVILRNIFYNRNKIMIKGRSVRENIDPAKVSNLSAVADRQRRLKILRPLFLSTLLRLQ